ncbi:MAG: hypothetical protein OJF49_001015 [Ktedonobacterales bacterium]|jgi:HSP20 family protein|nr:MAG: hypothetical protein OJF49_001015 [Ktedonobacterales bacterium]
MSMSVFDPMESPLPLRDVMNRLIDSSFFGMGLPSFPTYRLPVDILETDTSYVVEAALPGFKPEEVEVTAKGGVLTIHAATKRETKEEKAGNYVRRERYAGEVTRTFEMPGSVDADKVQATYEHGVLTLTIPKSTAASPKRIPVNPKAH